MDIGLLVSLLVVLATIYFLLKQFETRMVLIGAGLVLALFSFDPMAALDAFAKRMTSGSLIQAICASMGFAFVMRYTRCDEHLVKLLSKGLTKVGVLIIPAATVSTLMINTAIPSAAGCAAAAGATLIPLMMRAGIHPAMAAGAVLAGTIGSLLSPGMSHNAFVANMADMTVVEMIAYHSPFSLTVMAISVVGVTIVALVLKDHVYEGISETADEGPDAVTSPNVIYALCPFVPLAILLAGNSFYPAMKTGVPQAMVIGCLLALLLTRVNPAKLSKEFFSGMANGYGEVIGIIIAASVFAEGLKVSGLIGEFIEILKSSNEIAQWGASLGPFLMAVLTGSGDAAAYAFNETVTPHAADIGYTIPDLGMLAAIAGSLGRTMSPVAGVTIVCAGIAGISPIEVVKRTAPAMIFAVFVLALIMG